MRKLNNIVFCALALMVTLAVAANLAFGAAGGSEIPARSSLEGRAYTDLPELSPETVMDKSFQKKAESYLADHVPMRDGVILANANFQRRLIETANAAFNWECYPSKLGATQIVFPREGEVTGLARPLEKKVSEGAGNWVESVNTTAAGHPDVRFVYDILDDTYSSEFNPTRKYVSNAWPVGWIADNVVDALSDGIEPIYDAIESRDEYFEDWFRTEHHWTMRRAVTSYNKLAEVLGWEAVPWEGEFLATERWYGSSARSGLDLDYSDVLVDIPCDYSGLSCKVNGEPAQRGAKAAIAAGEAESFDAGDPPYNAFGNYFGGVKGEAVWTNELDESGLNCLFVEQSYGPPLEPYIARNYATTVCVDPLNAKMSKSFDEYIDEYDVDVVVIQLGVRDLHKIKENSPSWVR